MKIILHNIETVEDLTSAAAFAKEIMSSDTWKKTGAARIGGKMFYMNRRDTGITIRCYEEV